MKIHFCGAAGTTTGSQHLLEVNGCRILLDCGMYQGRREEAWHINKDFPYFSPAEVDAVVPVSYTISEPTRLRRISYAVFAFPITVSHKPNAMSISGMSINRRPR